jgi:hypothetical protein
MDRFLYEIIINRFLVPFGDICVKYFSIYKKEEWIKLKKAFVSGEFQIESIELLISLIGTIISCSICPLIPSFISAMLIGSSISVVSRLAGILTGKLLLKSIVYNNGVRNFLSEFETENVFGPPSHEYEPINIFNPPKLRFNTNVFGPTLTNF